MGQSEIRILNEIEREREIERKHRTEREVDRELVRSAALVAMATLLSNENFCEEYRNRSSDYEHMDIFEFTADVACKYAQAMEKRLRQ